jgi:adenine-specific DNA-methyltransferase
MMEKIENGHPLSQSSDFVAQNIETLKILFPTIVKEGKIDIKELQALLGAEVESDDEYYRFTWAGKSMARREANKPSTATLRPDKASSKDWDSTKNIFIEGDNLEVLKLLQKSYANKIKMIYIDPPYNTGKDFVYKDNYNDNLGNYLAITGQVDDEGKRISTNSESDGRYHSNWLNMMYPRLKLARNLLTDDGVIFISIDDNEVNNLKKLTDEIFGENNFIANIIRNTNSSKNQSLFVSVSHEYCLVYSKNMDFLKIKHSENKWSVPKNNTDEYLKKIIQLRKEGLSNDEISEELKTLTKYPRFIDFTNYWYFDDKGLYMKDNLGGVANGNMNPIFNKITEKLDPIPPGGFRYNKEKLDTLIKEDRIHFHSDGSLPRIKRYLHENEEQRPKSIMSDDQRPDYALLIELNTPFDNPKQLTFMKRIIGLTDRDSLVLDFFAGSGTTAHAVIQLNSEDGGTRKFISVQLPEPTDEKGEAYKAGYKTISEITKERIRRAGEKIKSELKDDLFSKVGKTLDIGFRAFKLDSSNIRAWDGNPDALEDNLFNAGSNIKENRTEEDVLYEILLKYGLDLTMPIEQKQIAGKQVFNIGMGALFICLGDNITTEVAEGIGKWKEEQQPATSKVIFKDTGFTDVEKTNSMQILKRFGIHEVNTI